MASGANVAIRFNDRDKRALREIARRFCGGNQSELLRLLVRETFEFMMEKDTQGQKNNQTNTQPAN